MSNPPNPIRILVLGDVNRDTLIIPRHQERRAESERMTWESEGNFWERSELGGSWLLQRIIEAAVKLEDEVKARVVTAAAEKISAAADGLKEGKTKVKEDAQKIIKAAKEAEATAAAQKSTATPAPGGGAADWKTEVAKAAREIENAVKEDTEAEEVKSRAHLIRALVEFRAEVSTYGQPAPSPEPSLLNSCVLVGLFEQEPGSKKKVYRMERHLGWLHKEKDPKGSTLYDQSLRECLKSIPAPGAEQAKPDILVLHDKNSHFRRLLLDDGKTHAVKKAIESQIGDDTWIVWHMYSPLATDKLWQEFKADWLKRTVAVVKVECLRQAGANLPEQISLERESQHFLTSIEREPRLIALTRARHLIVHFHRLGVLHHEQGRGLKTACYYCPEVPEYAESANGSMLGYTSLLVSAIVRGLAWRRCLDRDTDDLGIVDGIKQGVVLDHLYYLNGYGPEDSMKPGTTPPEPYSRLFADLSSARKEKWDGDWQKYRLAALPLPGGSEILSKWSRIEGFIERRREGDNRAARPHPGEAEAEVLAREIVRRGLKAVVNEEGEPPDPLATPGTPPNIVFCPYEEHGKIKTADRHEIDSLSSIRRIMEKYIHREQWKHPLSIAVFGPPGSGKGFTIKQLLQTVEPELAKRPLEYNVAQFNDVKDLETAFHQAQDRALNDEVPLVVFDEFDANLGAERLGWLKYFLAPMQDGKFKAGESMYRIGRAIFVFAGGVSKTFSEFYDDQKEHDYFRAAKGPDFVSRLRGHLDIAGINCGDDTGLAVGIRGKSEVSPVLMFRRAVLLRSLLEEHLKEIFDPNTKEARIDTGVIRAFLLVKNYEHGVRSMQAIVEMTRVSRRGRFQKSSLPAPEQLNMHVNAAEFFDLVNRPNLSEVDEPAAIPAAFA
jgi:hypothetical protein